VTALKRRAAQKIVEGECHEERAQGENRGQRAAEIKDSF